jgi:hypothetical protein
MSTYTITHAWRLDGYGVVQTLEDLTGLVDGSSFSITGLNPVCTSTDHTLSGVCPTASSSESTTKATCCSTTTTTTPIR